MFIAMKMRGAKLISVNKLVTEAEFMNLLVERGEQLPEADNPDDKYL